MTTEEIPRHDTKGLQRIIEKLAFKGDRSRDFKHYCARNQDFHHNRLAKLTTQQVEQFLNLSVAVLTTPLVVIDAYPNLIKSELEIVTEIITKEENFPEHYLIGIIFGFSQLELIGLVAQLNGTLYTREGGDIEPCRELHQQASNLDNQSVKQYLSLALLVLLNRDSVTFCQGTEGDLPHRIKNLSRIKLILFIGRLNGILYKRQFRQNQLSNLPKDNYEPRKTGTNFYKRYSFMPRT